MTKKKKILKQIFTKKKIYAFLILQNNKQKDKVHTYMILK